MSVLNRATRVAFERRTSIGFEQTIQSQIVLLLNNIKAASDTLEERTPPSATTELNSEVSTVIPSVEPGAITHSPTHPPRLS